MRMVSSWMCLGKKSPKPKSFTQNSILTGTFHWRPQWHFLKAPPAGGWRWRWSWSRRTLGLSPSPHLLLALLISPSSSEVATSETRPMFSTFAASLLILMRRLSIWVPKLKNVSDLMRFPCEQLPWLTICSLFSFMLYCFHNMTNSQISDTLLCRSRRKVKVVKWCEKRWNWFVWCISITNYVKSYKRSMKGSVIGC